MRTSQGVGADATGGDFRFQGQWLESATGLYNFRARDYDSRTGTFLSRDPVDSTEQDPEALNPYQFVYNNPYVYSDPTGMFSLIELNAGMTTQQVLQNVQRAALRTGLDYARDKAGEIVGNVITGYLRSVLPGSDRIQKAIDGRGTRLEGTLLKGICAFAAEGLPQWSDSLWLSVPLSNRGIPLSNGLNCRTRPGTDEGDEELRANRGPTQNDPLNIRGQSANADFIFKSGPPVERQPKSWLIGDIKINVDRMYESYVQGHQRRQFNAITNFAKDRRRSYAPIALFIAGRDGTQRQKAALEALAISKGVALLLLTILPRV